MKDLDEATKAWRKILSKISGIPNNMILNGESIRSPELVTIKNGQKVPIGYDEDCIIHYIDPTDKISVVDTSVELKTIQSYQLHLIVYGNNCKKIAQTIKSNLYTREALDLLSENGIGLLSIEPLENASEFMTETTFVLRYDIKINFDCEFTDNRKFDIVNIENAEIDIKEKK